MLRIKIFRNLRTLLWLALVALIPLGLGALYWANQTGLPEDWREAIERELSNHGAHVQIDALTYLPLRGFAANGVRIFAEKERIHEISSLERVQIVLDNTRLAKGEFRLRKIELNNARLALPVDPKNPAGEALGFTGIFGTILMSEGRKIEVRDAHATVGGIDITLTARLLGKNPKYGGPDDEKNEGRRREMIANIIRHLQDWKFDSENPPQVHVDLEGDLSDKNTLRAAFRCAANRIEKKQYALTDLEADGELSGPLLTISRFSANDSRGSLTGHADYQLESREGRFDVESSIDIPRLLKAWAALPVDNGFLLGGSQKFSVAGGFELPEESAPVVNLTGHGRCESVLFRGIAFDSVESWFSWQKGDLFLRDLTLTRPDGKAEAKVLIEDGFVRLALHSTLPAPLYKPFFPGKPLEKVIGDFSENEGASTEITLEGSFVPKDRLSWSYTGHGTLRNLSYRGVPVKSASCSFILNHRELDFYDGALTFDYSAYPLRKSFAGPSSGSATIGRIRYDAPLKQVFVEDVSGNFWAAPMVRFFAPRIADGLEQYRFHRPPSMRGSGVVDVTPQGRTDLKIKFSTPDSADYKFLGENLTLAAPSADVRIVGNEVRVSDLQTEVFAGEVKAKFTNTGANLLSGEMTVSRLPMASLAKTYGFEMKGGGKLTGRIEFTLPNGSITEMSGEGLLALEKAELFSVPMFGPLSKVMARVLDDDRAGFERAKSAFCTFVIRKGILRTRDFQTATTSITFAGDGSVDLSERTIDFTIRLNARGLLGLITLPLRSFTGLFQFRGTGPIKDSVWENVRFTQPTDEQNEILLRPPPKALIVPEQ